MSAPRFAALGWGALALVLIGHPLILSYPARPGDTLLPALAFDSGIALLAAVLGAMAVRRARQTERSVLWGLPLLLLGAGVCIASCCFGAFVWGLATSLSGPGASV